ncbi:eCIS core domain-containing protein [Sorangium sp. So ce145]|uniref:eCIS core domain-containing protein n=1 Tax=Sorangium sp. So ce145 TaxID=3133285 RepID=UPI003F6149E9
MNPSWQQLSPSRRSPTSGAQTASPLRSVHEGEGFAAPPVVQEVLRSPGQPLDAATRAFMEPRFGHDFSSVRVHADARAAESAAAIDALAYTAGSNIVLGKGQFRPDTRHGRSLLAHELAHVVQQSRAPRGVSLDWREVGPKHTAAEREADHVAGSLLDSGRAPQLTGGSAAQIQRSSLDEHDHTERGRTPHYTLKLRLELDAGSDFAARLRQESGAPLIESEVSAALNNEVFTIWNHHGTMLQLDYLETVIFERSRFPKVEAAYNTAMKNIGTEDFAKQKAALPTEGAVLVAAIEDHFITDPSTSSLDLLPPKQRERYREFAWDKADYPGNPTGPNEGRATQMMNDLNAIRPERRANQGSAPVVTQAEFTKTMRRYVDSQLQPVPNFPGPLPDGQTPTQPKGKQLNKLALKSFLQMREAALQDGVALIVLDAYRSPETAASNAEKADNRNAVAAFSVHSLGIAIDLKLSYSYQKSDGSTATQSYAEATTVPMQNVVDMREASAHKWLFMKGAAYGWYPFQNEPWHWEYNPEGFHDVFREELKAQQEKKEKGNKK